MAAGHETEITQASGHHKRPIGTKIVHNVASGWVRLLVTAPVPFLLTPFLLRHLGTQGFGAWAVLVSINSLTSLVDIGVVGTLTKHVSQYNAEQDYSSLSRIVSAGILIFVAVAVLAVVLANIGVSFVISAFFRNVPPSRMPFQYLVRLLTLSIGLNLVSYPFYSIISGLQRYDIVNGLWALSTIVTAVAAAFFVFIGLGIEGLVMAIVLASCVSLILNFSISRRLLPQLRIRPASVRWIDIKELASFSTQIYVTQVASMAYIHAEKLLLAHFTGLTPAGWYDIGNDLAMRIRNFPASLVTPLMPAASELDARQDDLRSQQLYYRSHKYLAFLAVGIFMIVATMTYRFVELWLGVGFTGTAHALIVLTGVQLANLSGAPASLILIGKGLLRPVVRYAIVGMVGTLVISTVLISLFGFTGALYGTALSVLGAVAYLIFLFHRETRYALGPVFKIYSKPVLLGAVRGFLAYLLPLGTFHWKELIIASLLLLALYSLLLLLLRYFDHLDLQVAERFVRVPESVRNIQFFSS